MKVDVHHLEDGIFIFKSQEPDIDAAMRKYNLHATTKESYDRYAGIEGDLIVCVKRGDEADFWRLVKSKPYYALYMKAWNEDEWNFLFRSTSIKYVFQQKNSVSWITDTPEVKLDTLEELLSPLYGYTTYGTQYMIWLEGKQKNVHTVSQQ